MPIINKPTAVKAATHLTPGNGNGNGHKKERKPRTPRAKVRLTSTTIPGLWVRAFADVIERYGMLKDPNGQPMVASEANFSLNQEQRAQRKALKAAEKARIANMNESERAAWNAERKGKRLESKAANAAAERAALVAYLKNEILAGRA